MTGTATASDASTKALAKRLINEETCKHFAYTVSDFKGKTVQIANYKRDGKTVAQKVRFANKDFLFLGDTKKAGLYGQHLWRDGGKRLIITEGEIDALSISQLQNNKWPVVSVPNGAQGAAKAIAREVEWVSKFDSVVFAFDMDEPGQEAARECASLLQPGRAYIASLPEKDANACLIAGKGKSLIDSLWGAKEFRPDGLVDVASLMDQAEKPIEQGLSWPWAGLDGTYGRRRKELYGFGGGTGCGKSTVFKQIAKHVIEADNLPVGMLFLEEAPAHTLRTLAGMFMGQRVHVPGVEFDKGRFHDTLKRLDGKVIFYDHFGAASFDTIKEKIRYMVQALGIKDIFLDHLTALAATMEDQNERQAIDKMMAELSSLVQQLDCTIYYISHLTTPDGKPHEEGGRVLEKHFRGSRSIGYWSHFLFAIERDKQKVGKATTFRILKDRYTGDATGEKFGLHYDRDTGLLEQCELNEDCPFDEHTEY
jgi:twinkle protein